VRGGDRSFGAWWLTRIGEARLGCCMAVGFYNTLTSRIEAFSPLQPPDVLMYNCGPTVYDYAHIGNFRAFIFADVLRRFLELTGCRVHQVMNITDVGHMTDDQLADGGGQDKMQAAIDRLKTAKKAGLVPDGAGVDLSDPYQIARYYTDAFIEDAKLLGLKVVDDAADMPRATDHIAQMQELISVLVSKGHAYIGDDGAVYYSVGSFADYGALSGNTLDKVRSGAGGRTLGAHQAIKRHPSDFLLWKPDATHVMKWDSPWGVGYPGWHIECSAMAMHRLGRSTIDIHTGGEDNIFPHHECEIAQSRGATGQPFANLWMHARFLLVEGQKMSKSKGNFYTVRDVLGGKVTGKPVDPAVLRWELLKVHYRTNANFTAKGLEDSASAVRRLRDAYALFADRAGDGTQGEVDPNHPVLEAFIGALGDDLNISAAIGEVFKWLGGGHDDAAKSLEIIQQLDSVLGVLEPSPGAGGGSSGGHEGEANELCRQIDEARAGKDFKKADVLRQQLIDAGFEVKNTAEGTVARRELA